MPPEPPKSDFFEDYSRIEALVNAHNDQVAKQKKEEAVLALRKRVSGNDDKPMIMPIAGPLPSTQSLVSFTRRRETAVPLLPYTAADSEPKRPKRASLMKRLKSKGSYYIASSKRALGGGKTYKAGGRRRPEKTYPARSIFLNSHVSHPSPKNLLKNNKYNVVTFVPKILYQQFKYFFNLYFLGITISQSIPILRVGFLFTYLAPLVLVLAVTMIKEFVDDIQRVVRDRAVNREKYQRLRADAVDINDVEQVMAQDICVGDILVLRSGQRVPTDCVILHLQNDGTNVEECFIKTDQLDGETDWKMRKALGFTQAKGIEYLRDVQTRAIFEIEAAHKDIYEFKGRANYVGPDDSVTTESISLENTIWSSTVIASPSTTVALVVYVGSESKTRLNTNAPQMKAGFFDKEIDMRAMSLFWIQFVGAAVYSWLGGNSPLTSVYYVIFFRYLLLFSSVIPISLRVNLDLAKIITSLMIRRDRSMQNPVVRTTTIPEQLGRIGYIMSDKTGTLTQNNMTFRSLHTGKGSYETLTEKDYGSFRLALKRAYKTQADATEDPGRSVPAGVTSTQHSSSPVHEQVSGGEQLTMRRQVHGSVYSLISQIKSSSISNINDEQKALITAVRMMALCNTVVPIERSAMQGDMDFLDDDATIAMWSSRHLQSLAVSDSSPSSTEIMRALQTNRLAQISTSTDHPPGIGGGINPDIIYYTLQASSPDEISLVKMAAELNLTLMHRDRTSITLQNPLGTSEKYTILYTFPFTSATKRMAIVLESHLTGEILVLMKGADSVIMEASNPAPWASEQVSSLASKGLRTLVFAQRTMTRDELSTFASLYKTANEALDDRQRHINEAENSILHSMDIVAVTGVEDMLQEDVKLTIQQLRDAEIRIFLLTGDKSDTSMCIARSTNLVSPNQRFHEITMNTYNAAMSGVAGVSGSCGGMELCASDSHRQYGGPDEDSVSVVMDATTNALSGGTAVKEIQHTRLLEYISSELNKVADSGYECAVIIDGTILSEILKTLPESSLKEFRGEAVSKEELEHEKELTLATRAQAGRSHLGKAGCRGKDRNSKFGSSVAKQFITTIARCPAFVCSRCSPEQKSVITKMVASLHMEYMCCNPRCKCGAPKVGVLAIGDGGNDVSMIQSAAVGVGLVGKEGKQASLASDFSLDRFKDLSSLLLYHGRLNYIRGYSMAHYIFSRGMTISVMQAVFSALFSFSTIPLFTGWLMLGYTVVFTSLPVTIICFDHDLPKDYLVQRYPILYKDSQKNKHGHVSCFFKWLCVSVFQGSVLLMFSQFLINGGLHGSLDDGANFFDLVGTGYTSLLITELLTLGLGIYEWSPFMIGSGILSFAIYVAAMFILPEYFDKRSIVSLTFWFRVVLGACVAVFPPFFLRWIRMRISPTDAEKLRKQWLVDRRRERNAKCCKKAGTLIETSMKGNDDPL